MPISLPALVSARSPVLRYSVAVATVGLATLLSFLLWPLVEPNPFIFFFAAVTLSAYYGGLPGGLLATILSIFVSDYYFIAPYRSLSFNLGELLRTLTFTFVALLISSLSEARRRAERRWVVTLASIGDAVIATDTRGAVMFMNAVAESLTGWTQAQARGQPITTVFQIVSAVTREPVPNPVLRVLQEGTMVGLAKHTLLIARDGSERPIDDSGAPIQNQAGKLQGVVMVFRDVAEREREEAARANLLLREQAARAEAEAAKNQIGTIFESITDGFLAFDRSWRFTYVNHEGSRILGRAPDELLGKNLWEEFPDLQNTSFGKLYKRAMDERVSLELEDFYPPFDAYFLARAYPSEAGLSLYFTNVSERVKAQESLRQSEERYRAFIAQSSEGIWRFELEQPLPTDLSEEQQIEHMYQHAYLAECNDAMARMYGFEQASELVGARLSDFLIRSDPQNIEYLRAFIRARYRLNNAESHEFDREGNSRYFLNNLVGTEHDGVLAQAWGMQRDITERKQASEALAQAYVAEQRARSEAETALRLREQFLSIAAHELKTPLTSLLGNLQLLQRRAQREASLSERNQHNLQIATEQASRLNKLISAMLDISRIEAGQLAIEPIALDLAALAQRVVAEIRPTLDQHQILLHAPTTPVLIQGDELRIEQVLQNLIQNAVKYSPAPTPVVVEITEHRDRIDLIVADQGMGIPSEDVARLFQRFYRATNAAQEHISGMGIGLYVVKEIVELHGGRVSVASQPGQGSTFTISFPRYQ